MIWWRRSTDRWEELHPGVYRFAGTPATWRQTLLAACLSIGETAVASHRAAGALWLFAGVEPGMIEISVPRRTP